MEEKNNNIPFMTLLLLLANVVVFFLVEKNGSSEDAEYMVSVGASYAPLILEQQEWYRLITHFFLHFGWEHLFNNMISLLVLGYAIENKMGKIRFLILYFLCGIIAGVVSIVYNMYVVPQDTVSAGASGAIFGLMGALLVMLILGNKGKRTTEVPRFLLYLGISIYIGLRDQTIDNSAHIGGFLAGVLICFLITRFKRMEVSYED